MEWFIAVNKAGLVFLSSCSLPCTKKQVGTPRPSVGPAENRIQGCEWFALLFLKKAICVCLFETIYFYKQFASDPGPSMSHYVKIYQTWNSFFIFILIIIKGLIFG